MSFYDCDGKHFRYGDNVDEIHPFFENKREWSKIKDRIVGSYITCYLRTVQRLQKSIIIVDSFSGPGRFGDGADGSPLIICKSIEKTQQKGGGIGCIFSDAHAAHREALKINLDPYINKGIAETPLAEFPQSLSKALSVGHGATLFFYLDPYGIKDLEFDIVKQIYERDTSNSTEVLINFNFKAFMRMSGNWNYTDAATEIARKVKESKIDRINSVMGGNYWKDIITDPTVDKLSREDLVVDAYKEKIRNYFCYTYSIPVKELEESHAIPTDQIAKYHLIFGTRHVRAVQYMNDVANLALEPYLNQFKEGLLFSFTPKRFEPTSENEISKAIVKEVKNGPKTRPEIYEAIIPSYFMHYRTKNYRAMIDQLIGTKLLFPDRKSMKRRTQINDSTKLSSRPWGSE